MLNFVTATSKVSYQNIYFLCGFFVWFEKLAFSLVVDCCAGIMDCLVGANLIRADGTQVAAETALQHKVGYAAQ